MLQFWRGAKVALITAIALVTTVIGIAFEIIHAALSLFCEWLEDLNDDLCNAQIDAIEDIEEGRKRE